MAREIVLIVEDDPEVRAFLSQALPDAGEYQVLAANDGQEGLEKALAEKPDVILMDLQMPRLSGLDLLRALKERGSSIPAIVLSFYGSEEAILQAFRLGAKDFLQKPFSLEDVLTALENALVEERLRREKEQLTHALARANRRLQYQVQNWIALNEIAQVITSTLEENEVFRRVVENVRRILRVETGALLLLDPATGTLKHAVSLQDGKTGPLTPPQSAIAAWVAKHGQPLLIPDVSRDPRIRANSPIPPEAQSILCVPLEIKEEVIGVLEVTNKLGKASAFTQGDQELLTMLASWVAVAVENARLSRTTQELAAVTALRKAVATVAHHINNRLMAFSLELDSLERREPIDREHVDRLITSARHHIEEISSVVNALSRLEDARTVAYVGDEEMLDIDELLRETRRPPHTGSE
jgi:two-component system NtrC family sensor kinase